MATAYHVFGPTYLRVNVGAGFTILGLTKEGGKIDEEYVQEPIYSDAAGPNVPAEWQRIGEKLRIECELATWDDDVLSAVIALHTGNTEGLGGPPGNLLGTSGSYFGLHLPSVTDLPWHMPTCRLLGPNGRLHATKGNPYKFVAEAWRFVPGTAVTSQDILLYERSDP